MEAISNGLMIDTRCDRRIGVSALSSLKQWGYLSSTAFEAIRRSPDARAGHGKRVPLHAQAVLRYMAKMDNWHGLSQVANAINAPKTSAWRALDALGNVGLLRRKRINPRRQYYLITDTGRQFSALPLDKLIGVLTYGRF